MKDDSRPLAGRRALVTGGARRIGRELVVTLARAGADVIVHYLSSAAEAEETAAAAAEHRVQATFLPADLADPAAAADLIDQAAAAGGPPDILVNNASVFAAGALAETTRAEWDHNQAVNLRAPFLLSQALDRALPTDRTGDIINLNDYRALRPGADHFAYANSKVGLHGLTRSLAVALAPRIRVNELALGAILPPEGASAAYVHALKEEIPTRSFGSPADVAAALLFLLAATYVTGQTVCVNGGRHLQ